MYKKYQEAIIFVFERYQNVQDDDKCELFHTLDVGYELIRYGYSADVVVAGFLHDIFEETTVSDQEVMALFGKQVVEYVRLVTKDDGPKDWYSKNEDIIEACRAHSHEALALKAADVLVNGRYFENIGDEENVEKDRFMARAIVGGSCPEGAIFNDLKRYL